MQRLKGDVSRQVNKDLKFLTALNQLHLDLMRRCPYVAFPQESSPTYDEVNYNLCGLRGQALRTRSGFMGISFTSRAGLPDKPEKTKYQISLALHR